VLLGALDAASSIGDMAAPAFRLHPLRGEWEGRWAVDVNGPWRVTFRFEDGHAWEVDYVQYH
jgi:proteic killer suppression protein